jgi:hypothetical protein
MKEPIADDVGAGDARSGVLRTFTLPITKLSLKMA